jgi:hypothetical protein
VLAAKGGPDKPCHDDGGWGSDDKLCRGEEAGPYWQLWKRDELLFVAGDWAETFGFPVCFGLFDAVAG